MRKSLVWSSAVIIVGVASAASIVVSWAWLTRQSTDWWAAWGQWVGGVGTAAATLIAATAFLRQQGDQRRSAAVAVSGWVESHGEGRLTGLVLANAALTPVFDVLAKVVYEDRIVYVTQLDTLPPGQREIRVTEGAYLRGCIADYMTEAQGPKVDLVFRDAAGAVWHRKSNGVIGRRTGEYKPSQEHLTAIEAQAPVPLDPNIPS